MQKIINSNTAKYQPMLTDNLVLDDKPTVNSFNSVTSDGVARAIAGASGGGGAEYSAGTGISISAQDEISVDTTVIATKNDLSSYQPTISDLETIRSGASAGATAVQPSQLATVATSGSYADLSNKPTIPTVSDNVAKLQYGVATYAQVVAAFNAGKSIYLYTGDTDDGVVCSDITFGDDGGEIIFSRHDAYGSAGSRTEYKVTSSNVWSTTTKNVAVPTVDQSYSASSTNAQSGTAVAGALATVNQVPASTSADEDKVLTVNSSGVPVWAEAQGGGSLSDYVFRAVYGSTTYAEVRAAFTAGKSICLVDGDEDDGVIASDVTFADEDNQIIFSRGNAMNSSNNVRTDYVLARNGTWSTSSVAPRQVPSSTASDATKVLTVNSSGVPVWAAAQGGGGSVNEVFDWSTVTTTNIATCLTNGHNPIIKYEYSANKTQYAYLEAAEPSSGGTAYSFYTPVSGNSDNGTKAMTSFYLTDWGIKRATRDIRVSTPASSQSDAGKVLTVNSNGSAVWAAASGGLPSVTGNAGKVLTVNSGATGTEWTNFTQIEVVASMPASPTSGVLYIVTGA